MVDLYNKLVIVIFLFVSFVFGLIVLYFGAKVIFAAFFSVREYYLGREHSLKLRGGNGESTNEIDKRGEGDSRQGRDLI